jgi:DNA-binding transcriptional LysR family regulator
MGSVMPLQDRVSNRLKLRDLRLLLEVAERGSMAKAATHLNLTQSGVSRAVADLEHALGVALFDRMAQGVEPTPYGRALLKGGVAILDELRRSIEAIEHLTDPASGELRLGCTDPMSWGIVPQIIGRLVQKYPRLSFHVQQGDLARLRYADLAERRIDLALCAITGALPADDIDAEVLFEERRFVVAGEGSRWVGRRKIKLSDLSDEPWAIPTHESPARILLEDMFRANGLPPPRISVVSFSLPLHVALLSSGHFLSVLPGSMLRYCGKQLSLKTLPIELPARPAPVGIMTLKSRSISPLARLFIEQARVVSKPLADPS